VLEAVAALAMADDDLRADSSTASLRKYSDIPAHNVIPVYLQAEQGCSSSSRSSRRRSYSVSKDDSCWWSRLTGADADDGDPSQRERFESTANNGDNGDNKNLVVGTSGDAAIPESK